MRTEHIFRVVHAGLGQHTWSGSAPEPKIQEHAIFRASSSAVNTSKNGPVATLLCSDCSPRIF